MKLGLSYRKLIRVNRVIYDFLFHWRGGILDTKIQNNFLSGLFSFTYDRLPNEDGSRYGPINVSRMRLDWIKCSVMLCINVFSTTAFRHGISSIQQWNSSTIISCLGNKSFWVIGYEDNRTLREVVLLDCQMT